MILYNTYIYGLSGSEKFPVHFDATEIFVGQVGERSRGNIQVVRTAARTLVDYCGFHVLALVFQIT